MFNELCYPFNYNDSISYKDIGGSYANLVLHVPTWLSLPCLSFTTVPFELSLSTLAYSPIVPKDNVFNHCNNPRLDIDKLLPIFLSDISLGTSTSSQNSLSISCSSSHVKFVQFTLDIPHLSYLDINPHILIEPVFACLFESHVSKTHIISTMFKASIIKCKLYSFTIHEVSMLQNLDLLKRILRFQYG